MRIQGSKVLDAVARELGAIPQIMAFGELYQALQTGVVDGEDNVPSNILTQKFYEVQKYLTVSYHGRLTYALITNKKWWNGLPADVRTGLDKAVKETTVFFNDTAAKDNADALAKIKASGKIQVHDQTPAEKKAWIAKLMPVHVEMQKRFGKEFIEKIYAASGFVRRRSEGNGRYQNQRQPLARAAAVVRPKKIIRARTRTSVGEGALLNRVLNRLEEIIIVSLIAAATVITFIAVLHRYGASNSAVLATGPRRTVGTGSLSSPTESMRPHLDQSVLGAGARDLHVRLDGEVRRRARRAHRHSRRRRRVRRHASPVGAQAGHRVCVALRRAVYRRHRQPGRGLCLRARCRSGVAGARVAELDDLFVHPARFLSDVLPVPAGDLEFPCAPASTRTISIRPRWSTCRVPRRRPGWSRYDVRQPYPLPRRGHSPPRFRRHC